MNYGFSLLVLAVSALTGCASVMNVLRPEPEEMVADAPTTGGMWAERGMLDDYEGGSARGRGRGPASEREAPRGRRSWVAPEQEDSNERASFREGSGEDDVAFSDNPNVAPPVKRQYKNGARATRADFVDEGTPEGSLWASDGQTNYYFTKNKIRGVGDIVTINLESDILRDIRTEIARTLTQPERDMELALAQERMNRKAAGTDQLAAGQAAPDRSPAAAAGASADSSGTQAKGRGQPPGAKATYNDIDVGASMDLKEKDTMMAEIVERYPNGNYKIRGTKRVRYRNGFRTLNVIAIARGNDISEDDQVPSSKLYEYRIEAVR